MTALGARLRAGRADAYVHAVGIRDDDGLKLRYVRAVVGAEPPGWQEKQWIYEHMTFVALALPTADFAMLVEPGSADRQLQLDTITFRVPEVSAQSPKRRPSFAKFVRAALPWPTEDYEISILNQQPGGAQLPTGFLIASDAPSFPDPHSAFRAFFDGDFRLGTAWSPPSELALIRWADTGAYLGGIHATATELTVEVLGDNVAGCLVELAGVEDRITLPVARAGVVTIQLLDGLPSEAWVWLKRQTSWCDYRALASPWGNAAELEAAGVKIDIPVDPATEVETHIASGEGPYVEFKSKIPDSPGEIRNLVKTVAAFANGHGGTILFGVDPDESTRLGVQGDVVT
jgi:Putative DNA-binding domain